jgi:hypothetical protein
MTGATRRRLTRLALASAAVLTIGGGTAAAGGNSVHLKVPHVTVGTFYRIKAHGFAVGTKRLYLFIDAQRCGANPAIEEARTGPFGSSFGYHWRNVHGSFNRSGRFLTNARITDYACAYLSKGSEPAFSPTGVVAHAFKKFRVH